MASEWRKGGKTRTGCPSPRGTSGPGGGGRGSKRKAANSPKRRRREGRRRPPLRAKMGAWTAGMDFSPKVSALPCSSRGMGLGHSDTADFPRLSAAEPRQPEPSTAAFAHGRGKVAGPGPLTLVSPALVRPTREPALSLRVLARLPICPLAEGCQSGRSGRSRKPLYPQGYRGFESHPLRQTRRSQVFADAGEGVDR